MNTCLFCCIANFTGIYILKNRDIDFLIIAQRCPLPNIEKIVAHKKTTHFYSAPIIYLPRATSNTVPSRVLAVFLKSLLHNNINVIALSSYQLQRC